MCAHTAGVDLAQERTPSEGEVDNLALRAHGFRGYAVLALEATTPTSRHQWPHTVR
jgi:hypothetical protein